MDKIEMTRSLKY